MESGELGYTVEDYRDGVPPRAFGTETEYTDNCAIERFVDRYAHGSQTRQLTHFVHPGYMIAPGRRALASVITTNGGEMYVDSSTLEYATPECRDPKEAVLHERIGELIVNDTIQRIGVWRDVARPTVYKRGGYAEVWGESVAAPILRENSVGHHENYSSRSGLMQLGYYQLLNDPAFHCFTNFLALRKLIDGTGMVADGHFSITQKPRATNYSGFESDTTHGKKKAFQQKGARLEVRSGEGNKSDWATEFKLGLTSLVLRLIEHGKIPTHLKLYDANEAVGQLARNPLSAVTLDSGERMPGIDVLRSIVDAAYDVAQRYNDTPAYEQKAYADFVQFYDDLHKISLRDDDVSALSDRIDWAARYAFLVRRGATYRSFTTDDLQQVKYDLMWDAIGQNDIARKWFTRFGHTALTVAMAPPPPTRAKARAELIRTLYNEGNYKNATWGTVDAMDGTLYDLRHPLLPLYEARPEVPETPRPSD